MTPLLDPAAAQAGYRLEVHDTLASTNDTALQRAGDGDPGRLWIVAGAQTGGRGRHGRVWLSPPGNLYATLLLIDPAPMHRNAELGFVAGAAVAAAVGTLLPRPAFAIKWPNDLVGAGAKLSGLLLEARQLPGGIAAVAIGFGVNCTSHPDDLPYPTTDLSVLAGRPVAAADVFTPLSRAVARLLAQWDRGAGFAAVRRIWLDFAAGLGDVIRVDTGTKSYRGVFDTIDCQGRLVLHTDSGSILIDAGDVVLEQLPRK